MCSARLCDCENTRSHAPLSRPASNAQRSQPAAALLRLLLLDGSVGRARQQALCGRRRGPGGRGAVRRRLRAHARRRLRRWRVSALSRKHRHAMQGGRTSVATRFVPFSRQRAGAAGVCAVGGAATDGVVCVGGSGDAFARRRRLKAAGARTRAPVPGRSAAMRAGVSATRRAPPSSSSLPPSPSSSESLAATTSSSSSESGPSQSASSSSSSSTLRGRLRAGVLPALRERRLDPALRAARRTICQVAAKVAGAGHSGAGARTGARLGGATDTKRICITLRAERGLSVAVQPAGAQACTTEPHAPCPPPRPAACGGRQHPRCGPRCAARRPPAARRETRTALRPRLRAAGSSAIGRETPWAASRHSARAPLAADAAPLMHAPTSAALTRGLATRSCFTSPVAASQTT